MIKTLFGRYIVDLSYSSKDLWWIDASGDSYKRYYLLLSVMKVERDVDGKVYEGVQLVIGKLSLLVADALREGKAVKEEHAG